jgi:hypothetical protein
VKRPSTETGAQYPQASKVIYDELNNILNGEEAALVLPRLEQSLQKTLP